MNSIEIKSRRLVSDLPRTEKSGKNASLAVHALGYRAWGFGSSGEDADCNVVFRLNTLPDTSRFFQRGTNLYNLALNKTGVVLNSEDVKNIKVLTVNGRDSWSLDNCEITLTN